ncbi:MAG TPA: hypothetical protein DEG23_02915 [Coxiellaceae bacterium]|nr:MAG: hypothetical protein A2V89_01640 [Gammaproteobacteria bacterium RBG_16_37_9]HBC71945.1 hypothetical protein [Coxiellaceae bacterium]HBY55749.1 hypothetical protein [Coxiellaceae bacterium]
MSTQERVKVLIVDDVEVNVKLLEAYLAKFNFIILKAYGGNEALKLAREERPNLILLDVMMPDLDGFKVCETLRSDPSFASVPIVMVTAKNEDVSIVQSLEKGADDYIIKPVNSKDLSEKVTSLLAKAKIGDLPSQYYRQTQEAREKGEMSKMRDYSRLLNLEKEDTK